MRVYGEREEETACGKRWRNEGATGKRGTGTTREAVRGHGVKMLDY